jgi:hypothetical protein
MEEYGKVQALSSTNQAAEPYVGRSTTQPSMAPPVTEEQLRLKEEKKLADVVRLARLLHYYLLTNPPGTGISLAALLKGVGTENKMLLTSNYKELCLAVPSWVKLRRTRNETMVVVVGPSLTCDGIVKLVELHFMGVAKRLRVERSTSQAERTQLADVSQQNHNLHEQLLQAEGRVVVLQEALLGKDEEHKQRSQ